MTPSQARKLIGQEVKLYDTWFHETFVVTVAEVDTKRRTIRTTDGGIFAYADLQVVKAP